MKFDSLLISNHDLKKNGSQIAIESCNSLAKVDWPSVEYKPDPCTDGNLLWETNTWLTPLESEVNGFRPAFGRARMNYGKPAAIDNHPHRRYDVDETALVRAAAALKYYTIFCTLRRVYTEFGIHPFPTLARHIISKANGITLYEHINAVLQSESAAPHNE